MSLRLLTSSASRPFLSSSRAFASARRGNLPLLSFPPSTAHRLSSLLHQQRFSASQPNPSSSNSPDPSSIIAKDASSRPIVSPNPILSPPSLEPTPPVTWVESMPPSVRPFLYLARVDKPIGTWLLFWPCAWSIFLASTVNALPLSTPLWYTFLFGTGAFIMRGAGCTINDMWDHKIDKAVERTKARPLAAGDVTQFQALSFLGLQLSAGLGILTQLNLYSIGLGASSLALVVVYPFMKRITYWPQSVLGLAFNWGALLGWSAVAGAVDWQIALPLYAGGFFWTLIYDTIYAHQDKLDDVKVSVKSTALLFGSQTLPILSLFSVSFLSCLSYSGFLAGCSPVFWLVSVGGTASHLLWQLKTVDLDRRSSCWRVFRSNFWLGGVVAVGIGGDYWWRVGGGREMFGLEGKEVKEKIEEEVAIRA